MTVDEISVGLNVTASIDDNQPWVRYSEGNDGEPDWYRDVYIAGTLVYCDGEGCDIKAFDKEKAKVTLYNDAIDRETEEECTFTISFEQFLADFTPSKSFPV